MPQFKLAEPGIDPIGNPPPDNYRRRLPWLWIGLLVILIVVITLATRSRAQAKAEDITETPTQVPSSTMTTTSTATMTPTATATEQIYPTFPDPFSLENTTTVTVQAIREVTKVIVLPGPSVEVTRLAEVTRLVEVTRLITHTPLPPTEEATIAPSQTPWVIYITVIITETPTEIPTETPTITPTEFPTMNVPDTTGG